jgi:hypothetical protein
MFALPAVFAVLPGVRRCGCCGGVFPARRVTGSSVHGRRTCSDCARAYERTIR